MTKFELYNVLCGINDIVEEEQYGPETKIKEIRKLLAWAFPQIDPEMIEGYSPDNISADISASISPDNS